LGDGVHHGNEAQAAWMFAAAAGKEERETLAGQLREYCKMDTLAMVKVVDALLEKIS
jgi:uncharacterized protein (DUF2164 family)